MCSNLLLQPFILDICLIVSSDLLSGTVVRINLLDASCFFTTGPEKKLLLPAEKEKKERRLSLFQTLKPAGNEGISLSYFMLHTQANINTAFSI